MDWFEELLGFKEASFDDVTSNISIRDNKLHSLVNGKTYDIGRFNLVSLEDLREEAKKHFNKTKYKKTSCLSIVEGNVQTFLSSPENNNALFQVASQFNMLEMIDPEVTPEDGVTRYQYDKTQGPACAIAAGAATVFRNYFVPLNNAFGQRIDSQLDGLKEIGTYFSQMLNVSVSQLWEMKNGYALFDADGISRINDFLLTLDRDQYDLLKKKLLIGVHENIEITQFNKSKNNMVTQVFCSAIPVTYNNIKTDLLEPFSHLILEASYEATLLAGALNSLRYKSDSVYLTLLGGGAFGNDESWIISSIEKVFNETFCYGLDVKIVCYDEPSIELQNFVKSYS